VIRPTALGWKAIAFVAALVAAFYAAPYQNLYFMLLAFVVALGLMNLAWTLRNSAGVHGEILPIDAFPAGASSPLRVGVDSGSRHGIGLTAVLDLGPHGRAQADFDAAGRATVLGEIAPRQRGVYAVRGAWVESTYPLGMLRMRRPIAAPREIVVHPAPAAIASAGGGAGGIAAAIACASGSDQPSGVRDFRAGDEIRSVHWRATARRGRPVVTEWDAGTGDGLEVVLDRRADPVALEEALCLMTSLVLAARESKERLTVHTQGLSRTFGPGHAPWEELLRALAAADRLAPDGPPPPPAATTVLRLPLARARVPA
jgi:uncharacterized protein (DUF58 family)